LSFIVRSLAFIILECFVNFLDDPYYINYYRIHLYFQGLNFLCSFKRSISWVLIFKSVIFVIINCMHTCVHTILLILPLAVMTSLRRYGRLVMERYERKRNFFLPFAVLWMKDEIVHILIIITWYAIR